MTRDVEKENKELKDAESRQERDVYISCWPNGAHTSTFWGVLLVALGGIWLLGNFGLAMGLLWPLFFICLGLFYLSRAGGNYRR